MSWLLTQQMFLSAAKAANGREREAGVALGVAPSVPRQGVVDRIEMSDVATDGAAVAAFLAADATDVLAADTTDVLSAAKAASGGDDAYNF